LRFWRPSKLSNQWVLESQPPHPQRKSHSTHVSFSIGPTWTMWSNEAVNAATSMRTSRSAWSSLTSALSPLGSLLGVPGLRPPRRCPGFDPPPGMSGYFFNPTFDLPNEKPEKSGYFLPLSNNARRSDG